MRFKLLLLITPSAAASQLTAAADVAHTCGSEGPGRDSGATCNPPGTDMSTERDQSHLTGFEKEPRRDGADSRADTPNRLGLGIRVLLASA